MLPCRQGRETLIRFSLLTLTQKYVQAELHHVVLPLTSDYFRIVESCCIGSTTTRLRKTWLGSTLLCRMRKVSPTQTSSFSFLHLITFHISDTTKLTSLYAHIGGAKSTKDGVKLSESLRTPLRKLNGLQDWAERRDGRLRYLRRRNRRESGT